ncbi:MAG: hypothetical protein FWF08_00425 [Oscillospiraceae bacterium]|nr:hypothetical protein [Oscillospiraceae bacterium]
MKKYLKRFLALSVALIVAVTAFNVGKVEADAAAMTIKSGGVYYLKNVYSHSQEGPIRFLIDKRVCGILSNGSRTRPRHEGRRMQRVRN